MKKVIIPLIAGIALLWHGPVLAVDQAPPVDALSLGPVTFFEYSLNKNLGPEKFELKLPVALETQGLKGPLPVDDPVSSWFWEKYKDSGINGAVNYDSESAKNFTTPFMRVFGVQTIGTPVTLKIKCPEPDQIAMPLSGLGGKAGNIRYTMTQKRMSVRILDSEGDIHVDETKAKISLKEDNEGLEISWVPSMVERKGKIRLTAPVVMELSLMYLVKQELLDDGKINDKWTKKSWTKRRVAWLALPVCGMEVGENDEPLICPASMAPGPEWKVYSLGPVSVRVPDNWESTVRKDSGRFGIGDHLADFAVIRESGGEKLLKSMTGVTEKKIRIGGVDAKEYRGLVKDGKIKARLILFEGDLPDGRPMGIAASVQDDRFSPILDAIISSITMGGETAPAPSVPASPESTLPETGELGCGSFSFAGDGGDQTRYEAPDVQEPAAPKAPETPVIVEPERPEPQAPVADPAHGGSPKGALTIKKLRGFSDFTGRNETLRADGSPDTWLKLKIEGAQGLRITGLALRNAATKAPVWDTDPGNAAWLLVAAKKNKSLNQAETGALDWPVDASPASLDLYVQDNNTIAAGRHRFELVISFDNSTPLVIPMER